MPPLTKFKDALSLAGETNQELNQFRRNMIKPYLPPQCSKLADVSDDSKNFLFGDSIPYRVEPLRQENQTKSLLRDKTNLKRTTLKVNRSRQTTRPLQIPRKGIQTKGKNKEGLSNLTADRKHNKQPNSFVTNQHTNIPTHQYTTGRTASTTKGNVDPL